MTAFDYFRISELPKTSEMSTLPHIPGVYLFDACVDVTHVARSCPQVIAALYDFFVQFRTLVTDTNFSPGMNRTEECLSTTLELTLYLSKSNILILTGFKFANANHIIFTARGMWG